MVEILAKDKDPACTENDHRQTWSAHCPGLAARGRDHALALAGCR